MQIFLSAPLTYVAIPYWEWIFDMSPRHLGLRPEPLTNFTEASPKGDKFQRFCFT